MKLKLFFIMFFCIIMASKSVLSDFEETGYGARTSGMGNSFTGLADDVYAIVYNPGALGKIKGDQFAASYRKLYIGLDDESDISEGFAGYMHNIKRTGFLKKLMPSIKDWGSIGFGIINLANAGLYSENTFILSYGKTLEDIIGLKLLTGINIKLLSKSYVSNIYTENAVDFLGNTYGKDPVFKNGYGKQTIGIDMGLYYQIHKNMGAGLTIINLNQPDTGLKHQSSLPSLIKCGLSYQGKSFNILFDGSYRNEDVIIYPGFEKWILGHIIGLRCGMQAGSRSIANASAGMSYSHDSTMRIDYSFVLPLQGIRETSGSHGLSVLFYFIDKAGKKEPVGYQDAIKCYNRKEYISASYRFINIIDGGTTDLYLNKSNKYLSKIIRTMRKTANNKPGTKDAFYAEGVLAFVNEEYDTCVKMWKNVLIEQPDNLEVNTYINQIITKIESKIKAKIKDDLFKSKEYMIRKEYIKAAKTLNEILEIDNDNSEALFLLSELKIKNSMEKNNLLTTYFTRGLELYADKDYKGALKQFDKCLTINAHFKEALEYKAKTKNKIFEKDASALNKQPVKLQKPIQSKKLVITENDVKKSEELYNFALIKYKHGYFLKAIEYLEKTIALNPEHNSAKEAITRIKDEYKRQLNQ